MTANNQSASATGTSDTSTLPNPDSADATGFFLLVRRSSDFYQFGGGSAITRPQVSDGGLLAGQATGKGNLLSVPAETLRGRSVPAETLKGRKSVPANDDEHPIQSDQEGGYSSGIIIPVPIYRVRNLVNFRYAYEILLPLDRYQDGNQAPDAGTEFRSVPVETLKGRKSVPSNDDKHPIQSDQEGGYSSGIIIPVPIYRVRNLVNFRYAFEIMLPLDRYQDGNQAPDAGTEFRSAPAETLQGRRTTSTRNHNNPSIITISGSDNFPRQSADRMMTTFTTQHEVSHKPSQICYQLLCPHFNLNLLMTPTISDLTAVFEVNGIRQTPEKSGQGQTVNHAGNNGKMLKQVPEKSGRGQHDIVPHSVILVRRGGLFQDPSTRDDKANEIFRFGQDDDGHEVLLPINRDQDDNAHEIYRFGYDDDGHEVLLPIAIGTTNQENSQYSLHNTQFSIPPTHSPFST